MKKVCPRCGEEKVLNEFTICHSRKSGRSVYCKQCNKLYRALHKERTRKYNKMYRNLPGERERKNERERKYYHADIAKTHKKMAIYRKAHRDETRQYMRKWRKVNEDEVASYGKLYKGKNKEHIKQTTRTRLKKQRANLADTHVKAGLCRRTVLGRGDIPKCLVEARREYIKLGRKLKGIKDENNERSKRKTG